MGTPCFIAVVGPTCSGKSTACSTLAAFFGNTAVHIRLDDYFKPRETLPITHGMPDYERPESIDFERFLATVRGLRDRADIRLVLLDGFLTLADSRVEGLCDGVAYLNAAEDVLLGRRLERQPNLSMLQWEEVIMPSYRRHAAYAIAAATVVIDAEQEREAVAEDLKTFVESFLGEDVEDALHEAHAVPEAYGEPAGV